MSHPVNKLFGRSESRNSVVSESEALLERVRTGEAAACAEFVRHHEPRMLATCRRFLRCEQDCADAVQDAFISALRALPDFAGHSSVATWLHRIVVNACLMKLRSRLRHDMASIEEMLPAFAEDGHHARRVAAWPDHLEDEERRSRVQEIVRGAMDRLPEVYRAVLILRDVEELDTLETAKLLGITETNVKVRLHRARLALQTLLAPHFEASAA